MRIIVDIINMTTMIGAPMASSLSKVPSICTKYDSSRFSTASSASASASASVSGLPACREATPGRGGVHHVFHFQIFYGFQRVRVRLCGGQMQALQPVVDSTQMWQTCNHAIIQASYQRPLSRPPKAETGQHMKFEVLKRQVP